MNNVCLCKRVPAAFGGFVALLLFSYPALSAEQSYQLDKLLTMSLTELMDVEVSNVGSLTPTATKKIPAANTHITAEEIEQSGARSLLELLDIYVPGTQWVRHHWEFSHIGSRGIISDREDKVMIRLNGRVMNERTHVGAISERNFPTLQDIHHIDVIRGAGSSLYGLGAVSLVIDIHTYSAKTMNGAKVSVRGGIGQAFQSVEGQFAKTLEDGTGLWFYVGASNIEGADEKDAPLILGVDATSVATGEFIKAGEPFPVGVRDGLQYKDKAPLKMHLQVNRENTDFWMRYTRAGEVEASDVFVVADIEEEGVEVDRLSTLNGYEQFTAMLEHRYQFNDDVKLTGVLSFDTTEFARSTLSGITELINHREEEWFGKLTLDWKAGKHSDAVLGTEFSHEKFGLDGDERSEAYNSRLGFVEPWSTNTASLFGEWQWRPTEKITTFMGGRIDKNTYSDFMYSPRASVVWTPDKKNTWKFIAARSQRMNFAEENRAEAMAGNDESKPEKLDSLEFRYEHVEDDQQLALSAFLIDLDAIGWDNIERKSVLVGNQRQWGFEVEWEKYFGQHSLNISHAYTKLIDFDLEADDTVITAAPFGFGDDLNNWSNHITKVQGTYQVNDKLKLNTSLRVYWGFPGQKDAFDRLTDSGSVLVTPETNRAVEQQVFLNVGGSYEMNKKSKFNINFYNLLGLFDHDYNKRIYLNAFGDYRSEAPAAMFSFTTEF